MELKEITDKTKWEDFVRQQKQSSLLQSWLWREFQEAQGVAARNFFAIHRSQVVAAVLVLRMPLPGNLFYLYSPRGPIFTDGLDQTTKENVIISMISNFKREEWSGRAIFWRLDPELAVESLNFHKLKFTKSNKESQPRHTRILDLAKSVDDLLAGMKPKGRYNIRLAEKKGVKILLARGEEDLEIFWQLIKKTTDRNKFFAHPKEYYFLIWQRLAPQNLRVYLAEYQGKIIAGILVSYYGGKAIYLHGASDYEHRALMAPHLLQWQAIQDAKSNGNLSYDLWGVAPEQAGDQHPWSGITRFKESLGGDFIEYAGTYDYVFNPFWYHMVNLARRVRQKIRI